jgi:hypothetical protein
MWNLKIDNDRLRKSYILWLPVFASQWHPHTPLAKNKHNNIVFIIYQMWTKGSCYAIRRAQIRNPMNFQTNLWEIFLYQTRDHDWIRIQEAIMIRIIDRMIRPQEIKNYEISCFEDLDIIAVQRLQVIHGFLRMNIFQFWNFLIVGNQKPESESRSEFTTESGSGFATHRNWSVVRPIPEVPHLFCQQSAKSLSDF